MFMEPPGGHGNLSTDTMSAVLPANKPDDLGLPLEEREGVSIFVIDRDPFYRRLMEYALKKVTRFVEFMPDGITALKRARIRRPDLFICDPVSARVTSATFCRWVHEETALSSTPILIYSELNLEEGFGTEGSVRFLQKPFIEDGLLEVVGQLLPSIVISRQMAPTGSVQPIKRQ